MTIHWQNELELVDWLKLAKHRYMSKKILMLLTEMFEYEWYTFKAFTKYTESQSFVKWNVVFVSYLEHLALFDFGGTWLNHRYLREVDWYSFVMCLLLVLALALQEYFCGSH